MWIPLLVLLERQSLSPEEPPEPKAGTARTVPPQSVTEQNRGHPEILNVRCCFAPPFLGCTPKGAYSPRRRSRHLLRTPLLRTPSENPSQNPSFTVKPITGPLLRTLPQNPSPELFPRTLPKDLLRTLLRTLCCRTTP